jgi:hypothetical protein
MNTAIQIFEHKKLRVLTTKQMANYYEVETSVISKNFKRNENRFKHGVHFFRLEGEELRSFLSNRHFDDYSPKVANGQFDLSSTTATRQIDVSPNPTTNLQFEGLFNTKKNSSQKTLNEVQP